MTFRNYACWTARDAAAVLRTEALEGTRAIFMAVHSPIQGFTTAGVNAGLLSEDSEDGLLDALTGPDHSHLFCVVEGEPGSGKSHLIRWLEFQWKTRRPDDLVLPVPRSNGSLEGVLREMRSGLPSSYQGLFAGLGKVHDTTLEGRARDFHSKLANSLSPDYFAGEAPIHAEWAAKYQLNRLVGHHLVLGEWSAPNRILETLAGGSERNSRVESFTIEDVHELALKLRAVRDRSVGPKAIQASRKFQKEADELGNLLDSGRPPAELEAEAEKVAPMLFRLREALDARFNAVVQDLVGVGRDGLTRAFRGLRAQLARENRRLVLLLEDITSFQGVDSQLLDVLIAKSSTEGSESLCDLLSVVGITTDFFNRSMKSYGNLRERIALHIHLGDGTSGEVDTGLALGSAAGRQEFAANYLRAIRAGVERIQNWDEAGGGSVPNVCLTCPHRDPCHRAFGATHSGVGFYPLSPRAIDRIFDALHDPQGTMGLRTPRGMVQHVLSPLLFHPERLEQGEFPPSNLEGEYLPKERGFLLGPAARVPDLLETPGDQARVRRLIAWWASQNPGAQTEHDADGNLSFAGIPRETFEAFGLPWLGDASLAVEAREQNSYDQAQSRTERGAEEETEESTDEASRARSTKRRSRNEKSSNRPARVSTGKMSDLRTDLRNWATVGGTKHGEQWSLLLMEVLDGLPWQVMGVPLWVRQTLFTKSSVALEGTRTTDVRHFVVPREGWVAHGLDAWLALRAKDGDAEFHRRQFARFQRRLKRLVLAHIEERMLKTPAGEMWNPAGTAAQVLLTRAWLRGQVSVDAPIADQWEAILGPDAGGALSSTGRTEGWGELVRRTGAYQVRFREMLRAWIQLTRGAGTDDRGIVDAGSIAAAFVSMAHRLEPDLPPKNPDLPQALLIWSSIADIGRLTRRVVPALPDHEFKRIRRVLEGLESRCSGRSLPQYLRDVQQVVSTLHEQDPKCPNHLVSRWYDVLSKLKDKQMGEGDDLLASLDEFVFDFTDTDELEVLEAADPTKRLAWVIKAPAADLAFLGQQVSAAADTVDALWGYVETLLKDAGDDASSAPEDLKAAGTKIRDAAKAIMTSLDLEEG
ncbi:MAG: hypothetical protein VX899_08015 [Myxococcota bacterium]|nr:hypothetical protein [Myxococcota bacterium]